MYTVPYILQEKMLILFSGIMAVHDTVNGGILWKKTISEELPIGLEPSIVPFITDTIAGYFYMDTRSENQKSVANIYNTNTGALIASVDLSCHWGQGRAWKRALAKGPFLCCKEKTEIRVRVIKVTGQHAKQYEFVPSKKMLALIEKKCKKVKEIDKLLGFLGKSNILLGLFKLTGNVRVMFGLDLDMACKAKNQREVDEAFLLSFSKKSMTKPGYLQNEFQPIYRTDRARGCIDLIGTMKQGATRFLDEKMTVFNWFFVTELHFPRD